MAATTNTQRIEALEGDVGRLQHDVATMAEANKRLAGIVREMMPSHMKQTNCWFCGHIISTANKGKCPVCQKSQRQ